MIQKHTFISMLRGINVGGQKSIRMAELKSLYESLGLTGVQTYVQSGNVVFDSLEGEAPVLAALLEAQIQAAFGFPVTVLVRDKLDLRRILAGNPFLRERGEETSRLYVTFLQRSPSAQEWSRLEIPPGEACQFAPGDREVFLYCPDGYGGTKLSNTFFEKKLKLPATTRNWNTVKALYKMANER